LMSATSVLQRFVDTPVVRRGVDALLGRYAQRRVNYLDTVNAATLQRATLLRLTRLAKNTSFGRDHDFARIRSVEDYQARVPLRDYETFWQQYWQNPFPFLDNVTWPTAIPYFALSSGTTTGTTKYIPISPQMLASNRRAATTMLAFFLAAHPKTPLFTGRIFFLGGSTDLRDLSAEAKSKGENGGMRNGQGAWHSAKSLFSVQHDKPVLAGDLSGIATREVSNIIRPYTFPPLELALVRDWEKKMHMLAEHSAKLPITLIGGVPSWLLVFFEKLKQVTGKTTIADAWPTLRLVVHGGTKFDPYRTLFQQMMGSEAVRYLDIFPASEGFIA
jgi:hypothetical protein